MFCVQGATRTDEDTSRQSSDEVFTLILSGISLPIRFDSIRGLNDETHFATLVVEAFAR